MYTVFFLGGGGVRLCVQRMSFNVLPPHESICQEEEEKTKGNQKNERKIACAEVQVLVLCGKRKKKQKETKKTKGKAHARKSNSLCCRSPSIKIIARARARRAPGSRGMEVPRKMVLCRPPTPCTATRESLAR